MQTSTVTQENNTFSRFIALKKTEQPRTIAHSPFEVEPQVNKELAKLINRITIMAKNKVLDNPSLIISLFEADGRIGKEYRDIQRALDAGQPNMVQREIEDLGAWCIAILLKCSPASEI